MAGVQDTRVIDVVTYDPSSGEYALIMTEARPWTDSAEQLTQLTEKINTYAMFALEGGMARTYPQSAGKPLRFQLDCFAPPSTQVAALIGQARQLLADHKIRFVVSILS